MKSLYEQKKELFARYADIADGKYISVERAEQLLGKDAVQYAINASDNVGHWGVHTNVWGMTNVFTFNGFSEAFSFFRRMEIKEGYYNAYQTPDYLSRPEFAEKALT